MDQKNAAASRLAETTITDGNRVSLPARSIRRLGWEKGDRLLVQISGDKMILMRRPLSWTEAFSGKMGDVFSGHGDTLRLLEEERQDWDRWTAERGI